MLTVNQLQRLITIHDNYEILGKLEDLVMCISIYPEVVDILESFIGASKLLKVEVISVDDYEDIKLIISHGKIKGDKCLKEFHPNIVYKLL